MFMEVEAQIVALNVGIKRWCTPSFAGARADVEKACKKKGPYGVEAGMTVTIPGIGKAAPVIYTVAKTADGHLMLRSDYDRPTGLDAFQRKFRHEGYPELVMAVTRADSTSFDALPVEAGFTCERVEFLDTEEGVKWRRSTEAVEEEERTGEETEEEPALCSMSDACSRPDGHSGKCNSKRAVGAAEAMEATDEAGEEETVELQASVAVDASGGPRCKRCDRAFKYPKRLATHEETCDAEPVETEAPRGSRLAARTGALANAAAAATAVLAASSSAAPTSPASEASDASARKHKRKAPPPPPDWGAIQAAAQARMETEVPDEAWVKDEVNKAMAEQFPSFDFATADYALMEQQRQQFDSDIRTTYTSPLREAYEAAMTAVVAVAVMTNAPPPK